MRGRDQDHDLRSPRASGPTRKNGEEAPKSQRRDKGFSRVSPPIDIQVGNHWILSPAISHVGNGGGGRDIWKRLSAEPGGLWLMLAKDKLPTHHETNQRTLHIKSKERLQSGLRDATLMNAPPYLHIQALCLSWQFIGPHCIVHLGKTIGQICLAIPDSSAAKPRGVFELQTEQEHFFLRN